VTRPSASAACVVGIDLGTSHTVVASVLRGRCAISRCSIFRSAARRARWWLSPAAFGALPGGKGRAGRGLAAALAAAGARMMRLPSSAAGREIWALPCRGGWWPVPKAGSRTPAWIARRHPALGAARMAKVSPLAASSSYLAHVKAAWDQAHPEAPLHQQSVVLTVPASFDEGARADAGGRAGRSAARAAAGGAQGRVSRLAGAAGR
jgi:hypothetical protein